MKPNNQFSPIFKKAILFICLFQLTGFVFAQNLALNKPATQATIEFGADASRAVDGNTSGSWSDSSITHTSESYQVNPWWRVDLSDTFTISSIKIFNRTDASFGDRLIGAKVMVGDTDSNDPNDFTEIATLTNAYEQTIDNQNVQARYVLVYLEGNNKILHIAEVEVYGSATTPIPVSATEVLPADLSLQVGGIGSLSATISPSNASNQNISWSSSNNSIATVNSIGEVTAVAAGTATITVTTVDGGFSDTSVITVTNSGSNNGGSSVWSESGSTASYTGDVAIGTSSVPNGYKLAVDGHIRTREIRVDQDAWPDYVFKAGYDLPTLEEIQKHIDEKGHLPNIPSAREVEANGMAVGEMNKLLLEKLEEQMLYILQLKMEINLLKTATN